MKLEQIDTRLSLIPEYIKYQIYPRVIFVGVVRYTKPCSFNEWLFDQQFYDLVDFNEPIEGTGFGVAAGLFKELQDLLKSDNRQIKTNPFYWTEFDEEREVPLNPYRPVKLKDYINIGNPNLYSGFQPPGAAANYLQAAASMPGISQMLLKFKESVNERIERKRKSKEDYKK